MYLMCFSLAVSTYQLESRLGPGRATAKAPSFIIFIYLFIYSGYSHACIYEMHTIMCTYIHISLYI